MSYLTGALTKIVNGHPNSQVDDLLPWVRISGDREHGFHRIVSTDFAGS
ncbi:hypothetical protein CO661_33325 [Sinorhizobium fredii]|uniref:Transposase n=1 Tax=Rhizobium fredii TaxID=380 RepID=A0A2A6LM33_RHIFR|nr:hypothetical protein CO661_33325 [Sinorhizobium fredii]